MYATVSDSGIMPLSLYVIMSNQQSIWVVHNYCPFNSSVWNGQIEFSTDLCSAGSAGNV